MATILPSRTRATRVGILILLAYGVLISMFTQEKFPILIGDVISGAAVIGIAVLMFPLFRKNDPLLSPLYFSLKMAEGALMILAGISYLMGMVSPTRDWIYSSPHLYIFIISGFVFYHLLFWSRIVPRFISIWGGIAIFFMAMNLVLKWLDITHPALDAGLMLIVSNEVFLAGWLILKGFNETDPKPS